NLDPRFFRLPGDTKERLLTRAALFVRRHFGQPMTIQSRRPSRFGSVMTAAMLNGAVAMYTHSASSMRLGRHPLIQQDLYRGSCYMMGSALAAVPPAVDVLRSWLNQQLAYQSNRHCPFCSLLRCAHRTWRSRRCHYRLLEPRWPPVLVPIQPTSS